MITKDDSKNAIWLAYCDLRGDYEQLSKERDQLKAIFNEAPEMTFDDVKRLFKAKLAEHDAEVIERFKNELVKSVSLVYRPHIEGVCAAVQQQLHQKAQETK